MEHRGAHIGKLPQFFIGDAVDFFRILHDPRIRHEKAGNIRPVFIEIGTGRRGDNRTRHIRAAPGKGLDAAIRHASIKPGNHSPSRLQKPRLHMVDGLGGVVFSALIEKHHFGGVDKFISQKVCQKKPIQIFAPARRIVLGSALHDVFPDGFQIFLDGNAQMKGIPDAHISLKDFPENLRRIMPILHGLLEHIQQIGHLCIVTVPLARRRRHNIAPLRVRLDNFLNFLQLGGVRQRTAPKFGHYPSHFYLSPPNGGGAAMSFFVILLPQGRPRR